ncbi:unnamed protein product [Tenebrio molitor]|nr:unnamed protein product [Tenebrio molitor]
MNFYAELVKNKYSVQLLMQNYTYTFLFSIKIKHCYSIYTQG